MFVIFDLDGTLALCEHRRHFLEKSPKDWDGFYAACDRDLPNDPIIGVMNEMIEGMKRVEVWSGRREAERAKTLAWFHQNSVMTPGRLLMRPDKDFTEDSALKARWLDEHLARGGPMPDLVFDDRDRMVAMWRSRGIVCCQVAPGSF